MDWGGASITAQNTVVNQTSCVYVVSPNDLRQFVDPTIMRLLVSLQFQANITGFEMVHFGVIAWSDRNDVPDDCPDPYNDPNLDWMMTGAKGLQDSNNRLQSEGMSGSGWIESSAKRRMGNDKGLLWSLFPRLQGSYSASFRYLLKE